MSKVVEFLGITGRLKGYLVVGIASFILGCVSGGAVVGAFKDVTIANLKADMSDLKRDQADEQRKAIAAALKTERQRTAISNQAGSKAAEVQAEIVTRYVRLVKKVPVYVTREADAKCVLPVGAVRLHDAAAAGSDDPSSVSFAPGESDDAPARIECSRFVATVVDNYRKYRAVSEQLTALQDWQREQEAVAPTPQ